MPERSDDRRPPWRRGGQGRRHRTPAVSGCDPEHAGDDPGRPCAWGLAEPARSANELDVLQSACRPRAPGRALEHV
eukprot:1216159-Alexandrium_andersonii.AAC.1